MRYFLTFFIGIVLTSCSNGQIKKAENGLSELPGRLTAEQVELIYDATHTFPNNTQLSIALIENGETEFVGIRRVNDTLRFVENAGRFFEIGSISKVFTATLLSSLVQENRVALSDRIRQYLDFEWKEGGDITLQQLSNHTSGLPRLPSNLNLFLTDPENPYKDYDKAKLKAYFEEDITLEDDPGKAYQYSNLGAGVLGFVLTRVTQNTYEDLLQDHIFSKYGMPKSTTRRMQVQDELVAGLDPTGSETPNWDFDVLVGAGGIVSSASELSQFARAQFNTENKALVRTQKPTFVVRKNMDIAMGWHILKRGEGTEWLWHNGGTGGYTSSMTLDTANQNGVIILSNVSAFHKKMRNIDDLCFGLLSTQSK